MIWSSNECLVFTKVCRHITWYQENMQQIDHKFQVVPNCCLLLFFSNIIEPLFHLSPTFFPPLPNHPPRKTGRVCVSFQRFRGTLLTMELISESHKRFGGSKVQEAIAHVAFVPAETFTKVQHRHMSWSG